MTEDGDEAELGLVALPLTIVSCLKPLIVLFRQIFLSLVGGSLFSLLSPDGERIKGFEEVPVVVGVCKTANCELRRLFGLLGAFVK